MVGVEGREREKKIKFIYYYTLPQKAEERKHEIHEVVLVIMNGMTYVRMKLNIRFGTFAG